MLIDFFLNFSLEERREGVFAGWLFTFDTVYAGF